MLFTAPLALFHILDAIFFSNPAVLLFRYISPTHILFHLLYPRSFWSSSFSLSLCYFRVGNMEEIHFLHPFLFLAIYLHTYPISVTNLLVSLSMDLFQVTFGCPIFLLPIGFQYIYCSFTCVYVYANVNDSVINISNDFYLLLLLSNTSLEIYLDKSCQY
jgi:hypothetical protein